ncbi:MAG: LytTR family transcriptional regulator, partial [Pararhodobacter sp.]
ANAEWSNLPLSGLFVEMLTRLIASARTSPAEVADMREAPFWTPQTVLDGFGRPTTPEGLAPVAAEDLARGAGPDRPAGLYVAGERAQALNAGGPLVLADWPGARIESPQAAQGRDLRGLLLAAAAILLALDALGSAWIARGGRVAAALLAGLLVLSGAPRAQAQDLDAELIRAAGEVALAYVVTGETQIDRASEQGLWGLSLSLRQRTSVEPGRPIGVDLDR